MADQFKVAMQQRLRALRKAHHNLDMSMKRDMEVKKTLEHETRALSQMILPSGRRVVRVYKKKKAA
jgi:hypothetical protein